MPVPPPPSRFDPLAIPPGPVNWSAGLAIALGAYSAAMAPVAALVGAFVGIQGFQAAAIYAVVAVALLWAGSGIYRRSRPARSILLATSALGLVAIPALVVIFGATGRANLVGAAVASAYCAATLGLTASPAVASWYRRT